MKLTIGIIIGFAFIVIANAIPQISVEQRNQALADLESAFGDNFEEYKSQPLARQKRFTCNVLAPLGDSPCFAHCLGHWKPGGFCNSNRICQCY